MLIGLGFVFRRAKSFLAFVGALTLIGLGFVSLRACDDDASSNANFSPGPPPVTSTTATSGSPTLDKIKLRKRLIVHMPRDKPGLSTPGPDGQLAGFDVEITKIIAKGFGLRPDAVTFKPLPPNTVAPALTSGDVDLAFGGMVIGTPGLELAGPYLGTTVDVLVPAGSPVTRVDGLGTARVCAISGTGDADKLRARAPGAKITEVAGARQCLTQLRASQAQAIVADDGVLRGLAAAEPGAYRLLGAGLADQGYGVALPAGDSVLRDKIIEILSGAATDGSWQAAYDATLGKSGVPATPPR
jgi:glutamate transport system substrate-binding protein